MEREVFYYYLKDENDKPYGCVAMCENEDGTINRGVSLCSTKDTFKKVCARGLAFKRMNDAIKTESTVAFNEYNSNVLPKDGLNCPVKFNDSEEVINTKYAYAIMPTAKEHRILHKPED